MTVVQSRNSMHERKPLQIRPSALATGAISVAILRVRRKQGALVWCTGKTWSKHEAPMGEIDSLRLSKNVDWWHTSAPNEDVGIRNKSSVVSFLRIFQRK